MNFATKCKECSGANVVGPECLIKYRLGNGDYALYWECEHCSHKHFVQIDSIETDKIVHDIKKVMGKIFRKRIKKRSVPVDLKKEYLRLDEELTEKRNELKKKYLNVIEVEDGNCTL